MEFLPTMMSEHYVDYMSIDNVNIALFLLLIHIF